MLKRSIAIALVVFALLALGGLRWYVAHPGSVPPGTAVTVSAGEGVSVIVRKLRAAGIVRSAWYFTHLLRAGGYDTKIRIGTYPLDDIRSLDQLMERLSRGNFADNEKAITVLEGWSLRDIAAYLTKEQVASAEEFSALAGVSAAPLTRAQRDAQAALVQDFDFLSGKPANASLEGYLFPDTYRVYANASAYDITETLLRNFDARLTPELRQAVAASGRSLHEILTMASILEREVRTPGDKKIVADLFWRRLQLGMPLQADSTVNYATGGSRPSVTYEDLKIDSPYNTYKYPGLPPGPICNPGLESLEAAVRPTPNEYLFFLTDRAGKVYYAKTSAGHQENRAKYLGR